MATNNNGNNVRPGCIDYSKWDKIECSSSSDDDEDRSTASSSMPSMPDRNQNSNSSSSSSNNTRENPAENPLRNIPMNMMGMGNLRGDASGMMSMESMLAGMRSGKQEKADRNLPTKSAKPSAANIKMKEQQLIFPPGAVCKRCNELCSSSSACKVEHPSHLKQDYESSFGPTGQSHTMLCTACGQVLTKSSPNRDCSKDELKITKGPPYCFIGRHTVAPLDANDKRRVNRHLVVLNGGPDIQGEINALSGSENVQILRICASGFYDEDLKVKLDINLPNLEELQIEDVRMEKMNLTRVSTPKLHTVWMQNAGESEEPDWKLELPELKDFSIFYWGPGDHGWLYRMLEMATKLERFDSYKLRVDELKFISNHLDYIRLHRAELLRTITLWAPRLTELNLQACYDLNKVHFLKKHPQQKELPANFDFDQELEVNVMNACLGNQAKKALKSHPRVHRPLDTGFEDDDF